MSWSSRRKRFVVASVALAGIAVAAVTAIAVIYETPSCTDGKQNQDERGVDCGGACAYLCVADVTQPSVRFVRHFPSGQGRTDVIAYVDNPNPSAAARGARYVVTLYDADGSVIGEREGATDLPPSSTVPVFVPGFSTANREPVRAFLAFVPSSLRWSLHAEPTRRLSVVDTAFATADAPRITARVRNHDAVPLFNLAVVATVFDAENNALAASRTVLDLPAQGDSPAVFTWNQPFSGEPARTEIIPLVPLP